MYVFARYSGQTHMAIVALHKPHQKQVNVVTPNKWTWFLKPLKLKVDSRTCHEYIRLLAATTSEQVRIRVKPQNLILLFIEVFLQVFNQGNLTESGLLIQRNMMNLKFWHRLHCLLAYHNNERITNSPCFKQALANSHIAPIVNYQIISETIYRVQPVVEFFC